MIQYPLLVGASNNVRANHLRFALYYLPCEIVHPVTKVAHRLIHSRYELVVLDLDAPQSNQNFLERYIRYAKEQGSKVVVHAQNPFAIPDNITNIIDDVLPTEIALTEPERFLTIDNAVRLQR